MSNIVLYILMRTDMESLTPGKACAQAAHAANQMALDMVDSAEGYSWLEKWRGIGAYGTTVILRGGGYESVTSFQDLAKKNGVFSGSVIDRSYPIKDGTFVHHVPVLTCIYILGQKDNVWSIVRRLPLY